MGTLRSLFRALDRWQRRHPVAAAAYGVVRKFGDDNGNLHVVSLGWYGFTAIFPLLLVVVTVFGFVGQKSLGNGIVNTLHQFPVVGPDFNPAGGSRLHGSTLGLAVGLLGLVYGAQGVTNTAQGAMASLWNVPQVKRTGFLPRLGRSVLALVIIGGAFIVNAGASTYVTAGGENVGVRIGVAIGLILLNVACYYASFRTLTPKIVPARPLVPGAIAGGVAFTALITAGTGLLAHQLKNTSETYGTFGSVIGVVTFLLLLAKLSMYAAELNPTLQRRLYPRSLPFGDPTEADERVFEDLARQERRRGDEHIDVLFGEAGTEAAAAHAGKDRPEPPAPGRRRDADRGRVDQGRLDRGSNGSPDGENLAERDAAELPPDGAPLSGAPARTPPSPPGRSGPGR